LSRPAERLAARARAVRSRALVRRWELRQLRHAAGAWYRLARLLALTQRAWAITDADAEELVAAGYQAQPVGLAFEPPLRLFVTSDEQARALPGAREIALQASPQLLTYRNLALVPFDQAGDSDQTDPLPL
jgi:hypothetical protein